MKYYFILGSNPALSAAELARIFDFNGKKPYLLLSEQVFIAEVGEFDAGEMIKRLGGTIKIGKVVGETNARDIKALLCFLKKLLPPYFGSKFRFGFSNYSGENIDIKALGMKLKKILTESGVSARWVTSREETLSSVVVTQNKLIGKGMEIAVLPGARTQNPASVLIGLTQAVQPFKELSFRDYGRPARDDYSGMLPPKLAQIMINMARPASLLPGQGEWLWAGTILDPFCGSGTVLTEAMLMGARHVIGSDISARAIKDSERNIEWINKNYEGRRPNVELFNRSVFDLSRFITANSIDGIVTEPYLGPQRGKADIARVKKELENIYNRSLAEFYKVIKPGGRVVMVWPAFARKRMAGSRQQPPPFHEGGQRGLCDLLNVNIGGFKIINPIPEELRANEFIRLTGRNTIIYGRPGQKVWREIVVMDKK